MTTRFRAVCFTCKRDVADGRKATIHIPHDEIRAAQRAMTEWEAQHPGPTYTLGELLDMPDDVPWRLHCDDCNPHKDPNGGVCGGCYWFTVDRCATWPQLVRWTAHLSEKKWIDRTNWFAFIQAIADGTSPVGLIAPMAERAGRL